MDALRAKEGDESEHSLVAAKSLAVDSNQFEVSKSIVTEELTELLSLGCTTRVVKTAYHPERNINQRHVPAAYESANGDLGGADIQGMMWDLRGLEPSCSWPCRSARNGVCGPTRPVPSGLSCSSWARRHVRAASKGPERAPRVPVCCTGRSSGCLLCPRIAYVDLCRRQRMMTGSTMTPRID